MKYRVQMTATAYVTATVEVEAHNPATAQKKAKQLVDAGDVEWQYDGIPDSGSHGVVINSTTQIEPPA